MAKKTKYKVDEPGFKREITITEYLNVEFPDGATRNVYHCRDDETQLQIATTDEMQTFELAKKKIKEKLEKTKKS